MKNILILFVIIMGGNIYGQNDTPARKSHVDSIVSTMNLKSERDPAELAFAITDTFNTDSEKVRAIFYWITQNIAYDYAGFLSGKNMTYYGNDVGNYYYKRICHTIAIKKGICEDYALLFQFMCKTIKINCEKITGYVLTSKPPALFKYSLSDNTTNHAWNAVMINKKWYLIDVTWASGYVNQSKKRFVRKLNEFYYLTPPKDLIINHYPLEPKWQLLNAPYNMKSFIANARENWNNNAEKTIDTLKMQAQTDSSTVKLYTR